jgi:hypothetical protein
MWLVVKESVDTQGHPTTCTLYQGDTTTQMVSTIGGKQTLTFRKNGP